MAQKWPSTEREFLRRFPIQENNTIYNLSPQLKSASGSAWSAKHLQACRVLVQDHNKCLPILENFLSPATGHITDDLTALSYEELRNSSHRVLRSKTNFGSFFVSLADVLRVRGQDVPSRRLRENIQALDRPDFRSGQGEGFSSSPTIGSSPLSTASSTYSPQNEKPDIEEQIDRKKHEIVSATMVAQFISIVIDLYSSPTDAMITTEFSIALNTFYLDTPQFSCICQDDGAIWRRVFNPFTTTWINHNSKLLCSLEAKSSYSQVDSSGGGLASERTLAQQFCELLGSITSQVIDEDYKALKDQHRFLISAHQSNIMILYCHFPTDYLEHIYSDKPLQYQPYITIHQSRKYDLGDPIERRRAIEMIVALNKYFHSMI